MACAITQDVHLVSAVSHAHKRLVGYTANLLTGDPESGGTTVGSLYAGSAWDSPTPSRSPQPLALTKGQWIDYQCQYDTPKIATSPRDSRRPTRCACSSPPIGHATRTSTPAWRRATRTELAWASRPRAGTNLRRSARLPAIDSRRSSFAEAVSASFGRAPERA